MAEQEDVRPLSPAAVDTVTDGEDSLKKNLRRRKHIRWCVGCLAATSLTMATISLALYFTVLQAKDPIIIVNNVTMTSLQPSSFLGTQFPPRDVTTNFSMVVDVSVKNPNAASFKYTNTTSDIYYKGTPVGEARGPPGKASARRTTRMNVTVDIMADRLLSAPGLVEDALGSGLLNMTCYSRVRGRVKILGFLKARMTVKMNCSMTVSITRPTILGFKCKMKDFDL